MDYPNCTNIEYHVPDVFENGAIHWIVDVNQPGGGEAKQMIALDLATENYRLFPLPPVLYEPEVDHRARSLGLDSFEGFILLSLFVGQQLDIWKITDYGRENTWVKIFSLNQLRFNFVPPNIPKLIAYINSNDYEHVLIDYYGYEILLFHLKNNF